MRSFQRVAIMVSKECTCGIDELSACFAKIGGAGGRQLKIYGKSNDSSFRQIEWSRNTQVLGGSVSEGVDCEFDRNGDRSTGLVMFFLLRMAFWLMIVFALLPTGKTPESDKAPKVDTTEAVSAATAAMSDMAQFCTRQPTACDIGGQAASVVAHRAQAGAKKVYDFITEKKPPESVVVKETLTKDLNGRQDIRPVRENTGKTAKKAPDHTGSIGIAAARESSPVPHDTLTQDDLQLEWQAPIL